MHIYRNIRFIVLCMLIVQNMFAQQTNSLLVASQELQKLTEKFKVQTSAVYKMQLLYKKNITDKTPTESSIVEYKFLDKNLYMKVDSIETIYNDEFIISIYNQEKEIIVRSRDNAAGSMVNEAGKLFDTAMLKNGFDSAYTVSINDTKKELHCNYLPGSEFTKYQLSYNPKTYQVYDVKYFYREQIEDGKPINGVMIGNFLSNSNEKVLPEIFDTYTYISSLSEQGKGVNKHKDYTVKLALKQQ
jgi:hypothetical protein